MDAWNLYTLTACAQGFIFPVHSHCMVPKLALLTSNESTSVLKPVTLCTFQVISFAGELLSGAESLLRDGLHTSEVADGYVQAAAKVRSGLTTEPGILAPGSSRVGGSSRG